MEPRRRRPPGNRTPPGRGRSVRNPSGRGRSGRGASARGSSVSPSGRKSSPLVPMGDEIRMPGTRLPVRPVPGLCARCGVKVDGEGNRAEWGSLYHVDCRPHA